MNFKQVNEILSNISNPTAIAGVELVNDFSPTAKELYMDEYNEKIKIYSTPIDGIFMSITYRTDSYNENEAIYSIQFVTKTEKTVTDFEPI